MRLTSANPIMTNGQWSKPALFFLAIIILQAVSTIAIESYFLAVLSKDSYLIVRNRHVFYQIYGVGFLIGQLFSLLMGINALRTRNIALITSTVVFDLALLIYAITQAAQTAKILPVAAQVVLVLVVAGCMSGKGWLVYRSLRSEFGWRIYRALGANVALRRIFAFQQALLSVLFLDGFFFFTLWLQLVAVVVQQKGSNGGEIVQMVFLLLISGVLVGLTAFSVTNEMVWVMWGCIVGYGLAPIYFIYKLVAVNQKPNPIRPDWQIAYDVYKSSHVYLSIFLVILLVFDIGTGILCFFVQKNFGHGLRERFKELQVVSRGEVDLEGVVNEKGTVGPTEKTFQPNYSALYATMLSGHSSIHSTSTINSIPGIQPKYGVEEAAKNNMSSKKNNNRNSGGRPKYCSDNSNTLGSSRSSSLMYRKFSMKFGSANSSKVEGEGDCNNSSKGNGGDAEKTGKKVTNTSIATFFTSSELETINGRPEMFATMSPQPSSSSSGGSSSSNNNNDKTISQHIQHPHQTMTPHGPTINSSRNGELNARSPQPYHRQRNNSNSTRPLPPHSHSSATSSPPSLRPIGIEGSRNHSTTAAGTQPSSATVFSQNTIQQLFP
ncbi:hypothetical protein H4219_004867 [Mycoemilia scoparia]|uniref:Uncharacterized protein n=1 Tax=Mycoemilia scoparia TaxID=417184 RepID=A0A9W7ZQ68_9FUNG|nr:hypothetical protein H4219_004867 [Mycoemilia scoparia]